MQQRWWVNPTDPNSLRLNMMGLSFVRNELKLHCYGFDLADELSNHNLLQLERLFPSVYYLLKRQTFVIFDESDATMLTLHGSDIKKYLEHLEQTS